jgi:hypothetical protein
MPIPRAPGTAPLFDSVPQVEMVSISRDRYDSFMRLVVTNAELEAEIDRLSSEISRLSRKTPSRPVDDDEFLAGAI